MKTIRSFAYRSDSESNDRVWGEAPSATWGLDAPRAGGSAHHNQQSWSRGGNAFGSAAPSKHPHKCSETLKNPLKHHRTAGNVGFFCVGLSRAKLFCNIILVFPYSFVNWGFIHLIVVNTWEETCICQIRWHIPITFAVRRLSQGRHRVGA